MIPAARDVVQGCIDRIWDDIDEDALTLSLTHRMAYSDLSLKTIRSFTGAQSPYPVCAMNCDETRLPLRTDQFAYILLTHVLEFTHHPIDTIHEIERILQPGGRAILVVANRSGLWARRDGSLLGDGQPYSLAQLSTLLRQSRLSITRSRHCLITPPVSKKYFAKIAKVFEPLAPFFPLLCGVHVVEVEKRVHGLPPGKLVKRNKNLGWGKPAMPGL